MGHTVDGWVVGDDGESTLEDGTYSIDIVLMVQKSQGQPLGRYIKPC